MWRSAREVPSATLGRRYFAGTVGDGSYTFGDSTLAASRLALLAEVFGETTVSRPEHDRRSRSWRAGLS
jgi:hypothetical protein